MFLWTKTWQTAEMSSCNERRCWCDHWDNNGTGEWFSNCWSAHQGRHQYALDRNQQSWIYTFQELPLKVSHSYFEARERIVSAQEEISK